jgi:hypothetical protein
MLMVTHLMKFQVVCLYRTWRFIIVLITAQCRTLYELSQSTLGTHICWRFILISPPIYA